MQGLCRKWQLKQLHEVLFAVDEYLCLTIRGSSQWTVSPAQQTYAVSPLWLTQYCLTWLAGLGMFYLATLLRLLHLSVSPSQLNWICSSGWLTQIDSPCQVSRAVTPFRLTQDCITWLPDPSVTPIFLT